MISQPVVYGALAAATIILTAIGFGLVYRVAGFFHFAHGVVFTAGAYLSFTFNVWLGIPPLFSILLAVALSTLLGMLMEFLAYRPLRSKRSSRFVLVLVSLGIYIGLENVVSMIFGNETRSMRWGPVRTGMSILGARTTFVQIAIISVSVCLVAIVSILLRKTKGGIAMRAVAADCTLASVSGIESQRVILWTFGLASALAGTAGVLVALDVDMTPTMGMRALMLGVVAVIIGGIGSIPGMALGALFLGLAQHFAVWKIGSQWQDAIAFIILLAFLLLRPQGFFGKRVGKATV